VIKILIVGNYGNYNIGDETILKGIIHEFLRSHGNQVTFYVITRNPNYVIEYHPELQHLIHAIPLSIHNILKLLLRIDLIVIGGGGIWSRYTGFLARLLPMFAIFAKMFLRKRVVFKNIGIYRTASTIDRFFVNIAILFSDACTVRDIESYEILWRANRAKTKVELDKALAYLKKIHGTIYDNGSLKKEQQFDIPEIKELERLRQKCSLLIGFALKPLRDIKKTALMINEIVRLIKKLSIIYNNKLCIVFFPFAKTSTIWENDLALARTIVKRIHHIVGPNNVVIINIQNPNKVYSIMKKYIDILIGMRYHAILFAYAANDKIIAIPYENKVLQFLKIAKLSSVPLDKLTSDSLLKKIAEVMGIENA
jgi:polysaccharide pyruvyl transferase WcaK-like protein